MKFRKWGNRADLELRVRYELLHALQNPDSFGEWVYCITIV